MYVISASKKRRSGPDVGTYNATVTNVSFDESYADGEAFRIEYELVDSDGRKYSYAELFHNTEKNERTAQFFEYVEEQGIQFTEDGLPDMVGQSETVVLKKRAGYSRPVIVERAFMSGDEEGQVG